MYTCLFLLVLFLCMYPSCFLFFSLFFLWMNLLGVHTPAGDDVIGSLRFGSERVGDKYPGARLHLH